MRFTAKQTAAYGLGAVGKDMVYALSASYVMYYYQDILGLSASFVGLILMAARVFDAVNDPFMGVIVAKTNTKWGRFRPWLFSGTVLNALVLILLFKAPNIAGRSLMIYFSVVYILWGMTYTMMDIPYWSMIPAVTDNSRDREHLSVVGRTCAGVGNALIIIFTVMAVSKLGSGIERTGFGRLAVIVSLLFISAETVCCFLIREEHNEEQMETVSVREMFHSLFTNDQAMVTVITIILINSALYLTSNLVIYFFKYDIRGEVWQNSYTLFNMVGGGSQILGMMLLYPLLRKFKKNEEVFRLCLLMSMTGYVLILLACFTGLAHNIIILCICGLFVFTANGMLTVLTTVFLSNTVDYGELKSGRREESVIFSMQTFVVKLASGLAVFLTGIGLDLIGFVGNNSTETTGAAQTTGTIIGLRLLMTILPILGLAAALVVFMTKFTLTDAKALEIANELRARKESAS